MSREARTEQKRALREIRRLEKSASRWEARIPVYLDMIHSVSVEEGEASVQAKKKLEQELESLLSQLEQERAEIRSLRQSTSFEANEVKLRLLQGVTPPTSLLKPRAVMVLGLSIGLVVVLILILAGRKGETERAAMPASALSSPTPGPVASLSQIGPTLVPTRAEVKKAVANTPSPSPVPTRAEPAKPTVTPGSALTQDNLTSQDPELRWTALDGIVTQDPNGCEQVVLGFVQDLDPRLRGRAAAALASFDSPQATDSLEKLSRDPEPYVRLMARAARKTLQERQEKGS